MAQSSQSSQQPLMLQGPWQAVREGQPSLAANSWATVCEGQPSLTVDNKAKWLQTCRAMSGMMLDLEGGINEQRGLASLQTTQGEPVVPHRILKRFGFAGKTTMWLKRVDLQHVNFDTAMMFWP